MAAAKYSRDPKSLRKEMKSSSCVGGARWAPYKKYRRNNLVRFLPKSVGWEGHRMEVKKMCYQVKRILPTASRLIRFCGLQIYFTAFFISSRARLLSARLTWQRRWRGGGGTRDNELNLAGIDGCFFEVNFHRRSGALMHAKLPSIELKSRTVGEARELSTRIVN